MTEQWEPEQKQVRVRVKCRTRKKEGSRTIETHYFLGGKTMKEVESVQQEDQANANT